MSLFQCENCGCCENTALSSLVSKHMPDSYDWSGIEERKGKALCSACGPAKYRNGRPTGFGEWHNQFKRVFLPLGKFHTNQRGNLEHNETGTENYRAFAIDPASMGM